MKSISLKPWLSWASVTFFYGFQYILRVLPNVMADEVRTKYVIDSSQFGNFTGTYYLGYALAHIPLGLMFDHFQPRLVIALSAIVASLSLAPLLYSDSWALAVISRFALGFASAGAILGVFKIIRQNFPAQKFGFILGLTAILGLLGAVYGGLPIKKLMQFYNWHSILEYMMLGGIALSILMFATIAPNRSTSENLSLKKVFGEIQYVLRKKEIIFLAFIGGLMVGPLEGFADVWGTSFLAHSYNLSPETAAFLPSIIFLGFGIGSPVLAYIAEKTNAYMKILIMCAVGLAVCFALILMFHLSDVALMIIFAMIGILSAYQVLVLHMNCVSVDPKYAGLCSALTNMIIMSFGYIFHRGIGMIMNLFWDGKCTAGVAIYSHESYIYGLALIPVGLVVAYISLTLNRNLTKKTASK